MCNIALFVDITKYYVDELSNLYHSDFKFRPFL